jgi:hypothetical protein
MCTSTSPLSEIYTLEYSPESSPFLPLPLDKLDKTEGGLSVRRDLADSKVEIPRIALDHFSTTRSFHPGLQ